MDTKKNKKIKNIADKIVKVFCRSIWHEMPHMYFYEIISKLMFNKKLITDNF